MTALAASQPLARGRAAARRLAAVACVSAAFACGGGTALVETGPHPSGTQTSQVVHEAPPPTKVETVPLRRNNACFWRGGYWKPRGGGWSWVKGVWVMPPEGCILAPAQTRFEAVEGSTVLVHRPELWYRSGGTQPCDGPKDCSDL